MNLLAKYKIMLQIKRFTDLELQELQKLINNEVKKRNKNLLRHK